MEDNVIEAVQHIEYVRYARCMPYSTDYALCALNFSSVVMVSITIYEYSKSLLLYHVQPFVRFIYLFTLVINFGREVLQFERTLHLKWLTHYLKMDLVWVS